jgi:hypothetical protein
MLKKFKQVEDGGEEKFTIDPRTLPDVSSEFCRMADLRRLFGITRSTAYLLAKRGQVKTVSLRRGGQSRSVRLVSVRSVRAFLHRLLQEQEGGNQP